MAGPGDTAAGGDPPAQQPVPSAYESAPAFVSDETMAHIESFFDVERCDDGRIMKLCHDGFKMASA